MPRPEPVWEWRWTGRRGWQKVFISLRPVYAYTNIRAYTNVDERNGARFVHRPLVRHRPVLV